MTVLFAMISMLLLPRVSIESFEPAGGIVGEGESAISTVRVRNIDDTVAVVWIGYSVMSPAGLWYDVIASRLSIPGNGTASVGKEWVVPGGAEPGEYRVVMAVWSAPPEGSGATRLARAERMAAFRVRGDPSLLVNQPDSVWRVAGHVLGHGKMRPDQVRVAGDGFNLRVIAGSCDGAEIRTAVPFSFGTYSVRMRTPFAPGSFSAFFLYGSTPGERNDEIDIEIFNDGSRKALLTAWVKGRRARESTVTLPFDPAGAAHDYSIQWSAGTLRFSADGQRLAQWKQQYPREAMRVMASIWWPRWLTCIPPSGDVELQIERISLQPSKRN